MRPLRVDADNSPRERKTQWKTKEERKTLLFMEMEQRERFFLNFNFSTCAFVSNFVVAIFFHSSASTHSLSTLKLHFHERTLPIEDGNFLQRVAFNTCFAFFMKSAHTHILLMQGGVVIWCNYCFGRVADCARHTN